MTIVLRTLAAAPVKPALGAWVSLIVVIVAVVLFTVGWRLAVGRRYEAHRWVQTSAVVLTSIVALVWMVRSLVLYVLPELPGRLDERVYAVNTVHAALGVVAVLLGVFVVLSASGLLPQALRFSAFKPWMRASFAIYVLAALGGIVLFLVAYGGSLR